MQHRKFAENFQENFLGHWGNIANVRKPIIAAVNGFALGGGKLRLIIPYDQVGYGFSNQRAQKLARFYWKNEYPWKKSVYFVNWHGAGPTKIGPAFFK